MATGSVDSPVTNEVLTEMTCGRTEAFAVAPAPDPNTAGPIVATASAKTNRRYRILFIIVSPSLRFASKRYSRYPGRRRECARHRMGPSNFDHMRKCSGKAGAKEP